MVYIILATFMPSMGNVTMMPVILGGVLAAIWMILFAVKLFKLQKSRKETGK